MRRLALHALACMPSPVGQHHACQFQPRHMGACRFFLLCWGAPHCVNVAPFAMHSPVRGRPGVPAWGFYEKSRPGHSWPVSGRTLSSL